MLKFHGMAKWKATLMALRASWNSPMSRISSAKLSWTEAALEAALVAQLFMLNCLMEMRQLCGLCSSSQPREETWPARPTAPMS